MKKGLEVLERIANFENWLQEVINKAETEIRKYGSKPPTNAIIVVGDEMLGKALEAFLKKSYSHYRFEIINTPAVNISCWPSNDKPVDAIIPEKLNKKIKNKHLNDIFLVTLAETKLANLDELTAKLQDKIHPKSAASRCMGKELKALNVIADKISIVAKKKSNTEQNTTLQELVRDELVELAKLNQDINQKATDFKDIGEFIAEELKELTDVMKLIKVMKGAAKRGRHDDDIHNITFHIDK